MAKHRFRNWLRGLFGGAAKRMHVPQWLVDYFTGGEVGAGVHVSHESALKWTAFGAAVDLVSDSMGQMPCLLYRRTGEHTRTRARDLVEYKLLRRQPNPEQSAFTFFSSMQGWAMTWGNAYAEIQRAALGKTVALWPIPSNRVKVTRPKSELHYEVYDEKGQLQTVLFGHEVIHIHTLGDGIVGRSPVSQYREAIGLGLAAEKYSAAFFGNNASPGGVLEHPTHLSDDAIKHLRESWNAEHGGPGKSNRPAILEEGMTWKTVGLPPEDSELIATRTMQIREIARIFHIPPHMLGDLERATFSNIEHQGIEYVTHCLGPWMVQWEQEIANKLFPLDKPDVYAEFLSQSLMRGDTPSRYAAYQTGINAGWFTRNEARERENLNPIDGLDEPLVPVNMTTPDLLGKQQAPPAGNQGGGQDQGQDEGKPADEGDGSRALSPAMRDLLMDIAARVVRRAVRTFRKRVKAGHNGDGFDTTLEIVANDHAEQIRTVLGPAIYAAASSMRLDEIHASRCIGALIGTYERGFRQTLAAAKPNPADVLLNFERNAPRAMVAAIAQELTHAHADTDE